MKICPRYVAFDENFDLQKNQEVSKITLVKFWELMNVWEHLLVSVNGLFYMHFEESWQL
jgi:hypothetical protein